MIAVDTNILVYAHREDTVFLPTADRRLAELMEGVESWAITWPCLHEFLPVVTNPRAFPNPTPLEMAIDQADASFESPGLVVLAEQASYWTSLKGMLIAGGIFGPKVHDARIAALCIEHGVRELWSADRDFRRFPRLRLVNPLIAAE